MVQDGAAKADIMKKFGYGTSTQLKVAYANSLIQSRQAAAILLLWQLNLVFVHHIFPSLS
jgi:hypothetical protein